MKVWISKWTLISLLQTNIVKMSWNIAIGYQIWYKFINHSLECQLCRNNNNSFVYQLFRRNTNYLSTFLYIGLENINILEHTWASSLVVEVTLYMTTWHHEQKEKKEKRKIRGGGGRGNQEIISSHRPLVHKDNCTRSAETVS